MLVWKMEGGNWNKAKEKGLQQQQANLIAKNCLCKVLIQILTKYGHDLLEAWSVVMRLKSALEDCES